MASSMAVHSPAGIVFNNPVYPDESDPEEEDDEVSEDRSGSGSANYEELPAAVATVMAPAGNPSANSGPVFNEWRSTMGRAKKLCDGIGEAVGGERARLLRLAEDAAAMEGRVAGSEEKLNEILAVDVRRKKEAGKLLAAQEVRRDDLSVKVESQRSELDGLTCRVRTVKERIAERGRALTDVTPVVEIRGALETLRKEIRDFDLRIGVLNHVLFQAQIKDGKCREDDDDSDSFLAVTEVEG